MHPQGYNPARSLLWRRWVVASALGVALGWAMFIPLYSGFIDLVNSVDQGEWSRAIAGACTWSIVYVFSGAAQAFILRRILRYPIMWVTATIIYGVVYGFLGEVLFAAQGGVLVAATSGAIAGAVSGIVQWWVLRRYQFHLVLWIAVSSIAGLATPLVGWSLLEYSIPFVARTLSLVSIWIIAGGFGGAVGGAISGTALAWHFQSLQQRYTPG